MRSDATLRFPASVILSGDGVSLLQRRKDELEKAIFSYEAQGESRVAMKLKMEEEYAFLTKHLLDYVQQYGQTPTAAKFREHVGSIRHEGQRWGHNHETNRMALDALDEVLTEPERLKSPEQWSQEFIKKAEQLRVIGLASRIIDYTLEFVQDSKTRKLRTVADAYKLSRAIADYAPVNPLAAEHKPMPDMPDEAMYGWLGQKARESAMPLGYVYPAVVGMYAGNRIRVTGKKVHPALFIALVGDIESGKSQAIDRAERILGMNEPTVVHRSASSDRGLFKLFGDDPKDKNAPKKAGGTFVMALTELRHMFTKMGMQGTSLPVTLCAIWDSDKDTGTVDKFQNAGCAVTLSIVGGLKCATRDEFAEVFGADTMHGLYSRFIIGVTSEQWTYFPDDTVAERRTAREVSIPPTAWKRLAKWRSEKPGRSRLAEIAMRLAVITEAADKGSIFSPAEDVARDMETIPMDGEASLEITRESWKEKLPTMLSAEALESALRFAEWQETLREVYKPSIAISPEAQCTETILSALEESNGFKWNTMCKNRHWTQKWGASLVKRVRDGLDATGQMRYDADTGMVTKS